MLKTKITMGKLEKDTSPLIIKLNNNNTFFFRLLKILYYHQKSLVFSRCSIYYLFVIFKRAIHVKMPYSGVRHNALFICLDIIKKLSFPFNILEIKKKGKIVKIPTLTTKLNSETLLLKLWLTYIQQKQESPTVSERLKKLANALIDIWINTNTLNPKTRNRHLTAGELNQQQLATTTNILLKHIQEKRVTILTTKHLAKKMYIKKFKRN